MNYSPLPVSEELVLHLVIIKDKGLGSTKNKGQGVNWQSRILTQQKEKKIAKRIKGKSCKGHGNQWLLASGRLCSVDLGHKQSTHIVFCFWTKAVLEILAQCLSKAMMSVIYIINLFSLVLINTRAWCIPLQKFFWHVSARLCSWSLDSSWELQVNVSKKQKLLVDVEVYKL